MTHKFPTNEEIDGCVSVLHKSRWLLYVATTGASGGLQTDLWRSPGASKTVLGMRFLYDRQELLQFIGHEPKQFCSEETALFMAASAYARGRELAVERGEPDHLVMGVGLTAAVNPGDRPKKGEHRVHVALRTPFGFYAIAGTFQKGLLSRELEGRVADLLALNAILLYTVARSIPLDQNWGVRCPEPSWFDWTPRVVSCATPTLRENGAPVGSWPDGSSLGLQDLDPDKYLIYPGSFNPLHHGHERMAEMAERMTGKRVIFQLNASHPAKGRVPEDEMARRLRQFRYRWPTLLLDREGLYVEKARLLPGCEFLIGADAVKHALLNPRYFGGEDGLTAALKEFDELGTRFLVPGRLDGERYLTLDDIPIPGRFHHLFRALPGRWDISSTQLRGG